MSASMQFIPANDIRIAYREYGPADSENKRSLPLVMITGYGGLMEMWPPALLKPLAQERRVVVFDNRGLGHTSSSEKAYSIELFAEDAKALLDGLNIEQAHVLGWSMGAFIAQELALRHPARVNKLILLAGSCGGEEAVWPDEDVWRTLTDLSGTLTERIQRMLSNLFPQPWLRGNPDPAAYFPPVTAPVDDRNLLRQAATLKAWAGTCSRLPGLKSDALILAGAQDRIIPVQNANLLAERIPNAVLTLVQDGGHGFFYQFPELTAQYIVRFLED